MNGELGFRDTGFVNWVILNVNLSDWVVFPNSYTALSVGTINVLELIEHRKSTIGVVFE